jgi:hypothetical protein
MKATHKFSPFAVLVGLALLSSPARAADDLPSFKTSKDRETKEFVTKVGTAIIKAARARPEAIELEKYEYTKPKTGRHELFIRMSYTGKISRLLRKKKFTATIKIKIDSTDKEWEVLTIDYKDSNNTSLLSPNEKKIRKLIAEFNR